MEDLHLNRVRNIIIKSNQQEEHDIYYIIVGSWVVTVFFGISRVMRKMAMDTVVIQK